MTTKNEQAIRHVASQVGKYGQIATMTWMIWIGVVMLWHLLR
jgi:hypothetical protein